MTSILAGSTSEYELEIAQESTADPFGRYATCSSVWQNFGAFNVLVSSPDPKIGSVQVNTVNNLREPGRAAATARVERGDFLVTSNGIMEIESDFQSGLFRGPVGEGQLEIRFACESEVAGAPLDRTRTFTDVAARLTKEGKERIVSTAVQEGCGEGGRIELGPKAPNADKRGAITGARISPDDLVLWVGGKELKFETFSVQSEDARSGTFRGTTKDGIAVVGAYSCRE